jgi:hypothetical protein
MGTWNYRIIKETIDDEVTFSLREVYYSDDAAQEPEFWMSDMDDALTSDTISGLWDLYEMIGGAFDRNVMTETEDGELIETDDCAEDEVEEVEDEE